MLSFGWQAAAQHPVSGPAAAGRDLFGKMCSACHGDTGKGGRGADLTTGRWKWGGSDDELIRNITKGISGTQMPAIPMPEADARSIVSYLRVISGGVTEPLAGDPNRGRELFFGKGGCQGCHMYAGRGGRLGPDLTAIRRTLGAPLLAKAIADPNSALAAGYATVEIRTRDGKAIQGVARNEDTFSVQVMDRSERLHLLRKADLRSFEKPGHSLMPKTTLSSAEIDDVAAFLATGSLEGLPPLTWKPAADLNVTYERLRKAAAEPQNWLTYWGNLEGHHFSGLKQVTPKTAATLRPEWVHQMGGRTIEVTPLVVDGLMFVTGPLNDAAALDARTGRPIWEYQRQLPEVASHCTVMTNRGFAILGDRLYMATLDTHLVALDAKTGNVIWDVEVDDYHKGLSITHAPLAIDGKIIVGVTSGECGLEGFVDAFDAATGKKLWRVYAIAQPGDPNRATWSGDSAKYGGTPTWMTGTYDAETDTLFWTTGNPGPDYDGTVREGDNLYSCSVLAIDPKTGKLKWWFQYTPHDVHDWDANETPVLFDGEVRGEKRKLLGMANRNAFYYVIDRTTGEFLAGRAFARQTWAKGLDDKGRPIVLPDTDPTVEGNYVCPDAAGATNWNSPSYDGASGLLYVAVRETCATYYRITKTPVPGQGYTGGSVEVDPKVGEPGAIRALRATTGETVWNFPIYQGTSAAGVLGTAGGVVFAASADGNLIALDSASGKYLWHFPTGARIVSSPISYMVDGKQKVAIASQSAIFTFGLP